MSEDLAHSPSCSAGSRAGRLPSTDSGSRSWVAVGTLSGRDPSSDDILDLEHVDGRITTIHREPLV